MKVHQLTLAIAGSTAFALCASVPTHAQGTTPPPPVRAQRLVVAGSFKRLPSDLHLTPIPGNDGGIMMTEVGHVHNPPPPPPPGGNPIDSLPHGDHGFDPASLIFALHLKPGQKVPGTMGFWISDAKGHVVFQTALGCSGCTPQRGVLNLGLTPKAATAAAPFMISGNTMHLVTTTHLTEANQIHASIGTRKE